MSQDLRRKLKAAREKLGLSQSKFAVLIGVPTRTLISWENEQAAPRGLGLTALNEKLDQILAE